MVKIMKNKKIIVAILICILIISLGVLHLVNERTSVKLTNEDKETILASDGDEVKLTEEQYQVLRDSIHYDLLEELNNVERINAWFFLNAMREINFRENTYPGESGVGIATWILELLNVGKIKELTIVRLEEGIHDLADVLIIRIVNQEDSIYYVVYNRTWGLNSVRKESENGEIIYSRGIHKIIDGRIYEIERTSRDIYDEE